MIHSLGSMQRRALLLGLSLMGLTGCYAYTPVSTTPVPGENIALVITDRGRVELGERFGPELDQARGRFVSRSGSGITLAMRETVSLRGISTPWTDEVVSVPASAVGTMQRKTLQRGRTAFLATGLTVVTLAFVASRGFLNQNSAVQTDPSNPPKGSDPSAIRIPLWLSFGVTR